MKSSRNILSRILNRIGLLKYFNLDVPFHYNGRTLTIPVRGKEGFANLYLHDDHDLRVYEYFSKEIATGVFVDVGANLGQTLLKVVSLLPGQPVVCLEPSPACVRYLQELKEINKLDSTNIIPAALFDHAGIKKLYSHNATHTGASLTRDNRPNWYEENAFFMVNAITGIDLAQQLTTRVSFIKIDVEGAELPVLQTLHDIIVKDNPVMFCEVLDAHSEDVRDLNNQMKADMYRYIVGDLKYKIYRFDEDTKTLVEIAGFPDRYYSPHEHDHCNYVFAKEK